MRRLVEACPRALTPHQVVTVTGKPTGLRCPALSTARTPNCRLSFAMSKVTEVTLPTGIAWVQSEALVSLVTTSYQDRSVSGLASQVRTVSLMPGSRPEALRGSARSSVSPGWWQAPTGRRR